MNRREYRKKHGIVCDKYKKSINKQIILRDDIWKIVVDKFKERIFEKPEDNLLCFECIENLLGGGNTTNRLKNYRWTFCAG